MIGFSEGDSLLRRSQNKTSTTSVYPVGPVRFITCSMPITRVRCSAPAHACTVLDNDVVDSTVCEPLEIGLKEE